MHDTPYKRASGIAEWNGPRGTVKVDGHPSEHKEQRAEDEGKGLGARGTPGWFIDKNQRAKQSQYLEVPSCSECFFGIKSPSRVKVSPREPPPR